jgi:hypothetical protein
MPRGARATALAKIEGRSRHPQSARAPAHRLGVVMIARIMGNTAIRFVISLPRWKRALGIGDKRAIVF